MRPHPHTVVVLAGALVGLVFASISTYDFAQHLDRQVHSITCSFAPGLAEADTARTSGCAATLMSPYSSVLRTWLWGGIPISLPAMSVFAFLLFFCGELILSGRQDDPRATGFLALAAGLPVAASIVMAIISFTTLGAACKLCIAIYFGSALCFAGAIALWRRARGQARRAPGPAAPAREENNTWEGPAPAPGGDPAWATGEASGSGEAHRAAEHPRPVTGDESTMVAPKEIPPSKSTRTSGRYLAGAFGVGVLFVLLPVGVYAAAVPDHEVFLESCGGLETQEDRHDVLIPLDDNTGGVPAIEVLDPLCPACRGFEARLGASGLAGEIHRRALIFPLDDACNWMVDDAIHPGACAVSEAVLCAEGRAPEVLEWAFEEQEAILAAERAREGAAAELARERFPQLASCIGSPQAEARLGQSLRWAVDNSLAVLTPQLFVAGVRMCDEDTDLGLDFALSRLLERHRNGTLASGGEL